MYYYEDPPSFSGDAQAVANVLGVQSTKVLPMPPFLGTGVDPANAAVIVWLGTDLAPIA